MSNVDYQNLILTFERNRLNIIFWIWNSILTFELGPNVEFSPNFVFWHSKSYFDIRTEADYRFSHLKSYFDIQTEAECRILTIKISFWHSKEKGRILYFDSEILFWHSNWDRMSNFDNRNPDITFKLSPNFVFCHSKSYSDIPNKAEYRILTFEILFWHSDCSRISNFLESKSYFNTRT